MWYNHLYNTLYITAAGHGRRYNTYNSQPYDWSETTYGAWFVFTIIIGLACAVMIYFSWGTISDWYINYINRHKIKTVTIKLKGRNLSQSKIIKLNDDVNTILSGDRLPQILKKHKLSAADIISMSTVPLEDCFVFTIWYK